jgi:hypothetical protein
VTNEGLTIDDGALSDEDAKQYCYRHPDRETYVRCGRCDRPICTRCTMQGPVGLRCKQCGKPAFDPLTSFKPQQLVLGTSAALAGGLLIGLIGAQIGWFSLIVAFFGGGIIAEAVRRLTGYKQGPVMLSITLGGIVVGAIAGYGADLLLFELQWLLELEAQGVGPSFYLPQIVILGVVDGVVAGVGAYSRLR